jgi:hypothetical protein
MGDVVRVLAVLALGGAVFAAAIQVVPSPGRRVSEWLVVLGTVVAAVVLDIRAAAGFMPWLLFSVPFLLSFVSVRVALSRRSNQNA